MSHLSSSYSFTCLIQLSREDSGKDSNTICTWECPLRSSFTWMHVCVFCCTLQCNHLQSRVQISFFINNRILYAPLLLMYYHKIIHTGIQRSFTVLCKVGTPFHSVNIQVSILGCKWCHDHQSPTYIFFSHFCQCVF